MNLAFSCRPGCAVCCTTISIGSALPNMPKGKPAGVRCVNLDTQNLCGLWGSESYPSVCRGFTPDVRYCGNSNEEANQILGDLERLTTP